MSPHEFVIWFKGFVAAANTFNITPKQWDTICEYLEKVKEKETYTIVNTGSGTSSTNTTADIRYDITYKNDELTTNTVF